MTRRTKRRRSSWSLSWSLLLAILLATVLATGGGSIRSTPTAGTGSTCIPGTDQVVTEEPWPQERLGLKALGGQFRGWGVTVAVLSSGASAGHPQLRGRVLDGLSVGDAGAANTDCLGFGTAISGAAAAAPVSGTPLTGIAPQASVLPVRLPDWMVNPSSNLDDEHAVQAGQLLAQAITLALQRTPRVMVLPSVSLTDTPPLRAAVAAAEEQGCLLVEGAPASADQTHNFPAAYPEVVVVEGISPEGDVAPTALTAEQVDLIAPGMQVPVLTPTKGHQLVSSNAVAAGFVAGAAVLVLEAVHPRSAADVRRQLLRSTVPSAYGRIPVLDPAVAMTPDVGTASAPPAGTIGRLLAGKPPAERASVAATAIATTTLAVLVIVLFAAAATYRGRSRGWRPAGQEPETEIPPDHLPLTDDPFRPPHRSGAWWLARDLDDDGVRGRGTSPVPSAPHGSAAPPGPAGPPPPPDRPDVPAPGGH